MARIKAQFAARPLTIADVLAIRTTFTRWFEQEQESAEYQLSYPSGTAKFDNIDGTVTHWKNYGRPIGFYQRRWNTGGRETIFDATDPDMILVEAFSKQRDPKAMIDDLANVLDLKEYRSLVTPRKMRTAFVAVRFNSDGKPLADQLIDFLKAAEIAAETAEDFQNGPIPDKVKRLIEAKDLFVAIVIPQEDPSWIVSELAYAHGKDRPIMVIEQDDAKFNPGVFGSDPERIFFPRGGFAESFTKVLQGLQDLRSKSRLPE